VLLRRFGAASFPKGIDATAWADNRTFAIDDGSAQLQVQDYYVVADNDTKWTFISNQLSASRSGSPRTLFLNNTSGYKAMALGIPSIPSVSDAINPKVAAFFSSNPSGRFGIVAMDFIDASTSWKILRANFNGASPLANGTYKVLNRASGKAL